MLCKMCVWTLAQVGVWVNGWLDVWVGVCKCVTQCVFELVCRCVFYWLFREVFDGFLLGCLGRYLGAALLRLSLPSITCPGHVVVTKSELGLKFAYILS